MTPIGKQKILKQTNRKAILNILRTSGEISVAELSSKVNLSKTTLMKIMKYYTDKNFVMITGKGESTEEGGKKPNIFKFNKNSGYAVGMIIGANTLTSVITNLSCEIMHEISMKLETNEDFSSVLEKIIASLDKLVNISEIDYINVVGLALGTYGITDYFNGTLLYSPHFPSWPDNINLKEEILKKLSKTIPVYIDDAQRYRAFAEKTLGVAQDAQSIVSILAGKGMGGGVIMENHIKRGAHHLMGEIGHMIINPNDSEVCACGAHGCFEVMLSIKRILKNANDKKNLYPDSIIFATNNGNAESMTELFDAYNKEDALAIEVMEDTANWFATGLSNIILLCDPEVIVIHGIFSQAGDRFLGLLREKTGRVALSNIKKDTLIKYSELGDKGGVLGAASYVISKFFE